MFHKTLKTCGFLEKGAFAAVRTLNFGQIRSGGIGDFAFKSSNVRFHQKAGIEDRSEWLICLIPPAHTE
jgi:hypothetical protein